jgi:hypothetical protein
VVVWSILPIFAASPAVAIVPYQFPELLMLGV